MFIHKVKYLDSSCSSSWMLLMREVFFTFVLEAIIFSNYSLEYCAEIYTSNACCIAFLILNAHELVLAVNESG